MHTEARPHQRSPLARLAAAVPSEQTVNHTRRPQKKIAKSETPD